MARIVEFLPRRTTLLQASGPLVYIGRRHRVADLKTMSIRTLVVAAVGSPTSMDITYQGSMDGDAWDALGGDALTPGGLATAFLDPLPVWLRVRVDAGGGSGMGLTMWSVGIGRQ